MWTVVYDTQAFMIVVKRNVSEMERLVEQAESDVGSVSTVKRVMNSVTLPSLFTPVTLRYCFHYSKCVFLYFQ